jgi:hypothetical protein
MSKPEQVVARSRSHDGAHARRDRRVHSSIIAAIISSLKTLACRGG